MQAQSAEDAIRLATADFNAGRHHQAHRTCKDALLRWPADPRLNHLLAAIHFAKGDSAKARERIEESVRLAPQHLPARLLAARIARAQQDFDAALQHLRRIGSGPEAALEQAKILDQAGRTADARSAWRLVLQSQPDNREAMARLGRICWEGGNLSEAALLLERAVGGECAPSAWFDLGLVRQDLKDHAGAIDAYRQALARREDYAEAAVNLGTALQELGDLDGAFAAYARAYRTRPDTFATIAMALTSASHGRLWLDKDELRRSLSRSAGG